MADDERCVDVNDVLPSHLLLESYFMPLATHALAQMADAKTGCLSIIPADCMYLESNDCD